MRAEFSAEAARAMRRILVDYAVRSPSAVKRNWAMAHDWLNRELAR